MLSSEPLSIKSLLVKKNWNRTHVSFNTGTVRL